MRRRACGPEVISLAILADLDPGWHPQRYADENLGCAIEFRFPCCKLLHRMPSFEDDHSLPALAAKAQIEALRTAGDLDHRLRVRRILTRRLYECGHSKQQVIEAHRLLAWMMKLPREQGLILHREIVKWESELDMPYLTDIEEYVRDEIRDQVRDEIRDQVRDEIRDQVRDEFLEKGREIGLEQGLERGLERGLKASILDLITIRFGAVSPAIVQVVASQNNSELLREWFKRAATAQTITELEQQLN